MLKKEEQENPNLMFKCFQDTKEEWTDPSWCLRINNTLLWASSLKQLFMQCTKFLMFCGQKGIIFNPNKLEVGRTEVNIFGFRMTKQGILPSKNQIEMMLKYPFPKKFRDIRGFLA